MPPTSTPIEGRDWNAEVGGIEDAKQAMRKEFYEKRAALKGAVELTSTWQGDWQEVNEGNGFLFGALLKGLGGSLENKNSPQAKQVLDVLKKLSQKDFNVDQFNAGDKVKIEGAKLKIKRADGTEQELNLEHAAPTPAVETLDKDNFKGAASVTNNPDGTVTVVRIGSTTLKFIHSSGDPEILNPVKNNGTTDSGVSLTKDSDGQYNLIGDIWTNHLNKSEYHH